MKNGPLNVPETINFLGNDMTVSDYGYNNKHYWIGVSDYMQCGNPIAKPQFICVVGEPCYFSGFSSFDSDGEIVELVRKNF